ncbi:miorex complex component 10 [Acrodontium crateriforme]|uniref:Miorex complex component 10 n=1 Tax=Acrodontium crateriforme TaxID=150365 RepID=A0AAQ3LWS1_9PEZI|nr:miorex complex component 10 [Acrodontium crateriforme]
MQKRCIAGVTTDKTNNKKSARTAVDNSLRRIAAEAQHSRSRARKLMKGFGKRAHVDPEIATKDVKAYCSAETFNILRAQELIEGEGGIDADGVGVGPLKADPLNTGLFPQVLHVQTPPKKHGAAPGDIFIFPSGSVVTWNVPERLTYHLVHKILPSAAENGHLDRLEVEDLQYLEDPTRGNSRIVGDTIILGTGTDYESELPYDKTENDSSTQTTTETNGREVDMILTKIAFSSALARSAKLAVLEETLDQYFVSTREIPSTLSSGSQLRLTRSFVLRKTGELLNIRAQLNIYSELTDSLPDLFWDSPYELGLEGYYDIVSRGLDIGVRIKILNERMDYASEIASVLRERLSEKHSTGLEWLIIGLIALECGFGILHLWREREENVNPNSTKNLLQAWLEKELASSEK